MDLNSGEKSQHTLENEIDQSVPATPRRLSDIDILLDDTASLGTGSYVWKYFTKDTNYKINKKASCNYCNKTYICFGGTTSGISKHLQKNHAAQLGLQKAQKSVIDMLKESKVSILFYLFYQNQILLIVNLYL